MKKELSFKSWIGEDELLIEKYEESTRQSWFSYFCCLFFHKQDSSNYLL